MTNTSVCVFYMHTYIYVNINIEVHAGVLVILYYTSKVYYAYIRYLTLNNNNNNTLFSVLSRCPLLHHLLHPTKSQPYPCFYRGPTKTLSTHLPYILFTSP